MAPPESRLRPAAAQAHPLLQLPDLTGDETVGFGNEGHDVHLLVQGFHEAHVHWPQPVESSQGEGLMGWGWWEGAPQGWARPAPLAQRSHLPVPKRGNEVQAAVHTVVLDVLAVEAALVPEILLKLLVHVVGDGLPAGGRGNMRPGWWLVARGQGRPGRPSSPLRVVDGVPEAWCVHNGELQLDPLLLNVHRVLQDLDRLADALCGKAGGGTDPHRPSVTLTPTPGSPDPCSHPWLCGPAVIWTLNGRPMLRGQRSRAGPGRSPWRGHPAGDGGSARAAWGPLTLSTEQLPFLVQVSQEEAVDQCGLPQARLPCPQVQ